MILSVHRGGGGGSGPAAGGGSGPAAGGGVRSSCWGGSDPAGGEGVGQVQPAGGVRSSWRGGGGSAKIEQHREYLLHGGRYASCVHAGGLSCSVCFCWRYVDLFDIL